MPPATLALASGEVFSGRSFGSSEPAVGEVVFNTSLTGYQEIASDPSYQGQLVCLTAPHIGIVGTNHNDNEAAHPQVSAFIIRDLARSYSSWRSQQSLNEYFNEHAVTGICEIDTRRLASLLRDRGAVNGCVIASDDRDQALALARGCPSMSGNSLGRTAGQGKALTYQEGTWQHTSDSFSTRSAQEPKIAVLDCGAKRAIMRELCARQCQVKILPYTISAASIIEQFSGLVISNGPGDPAPLGEAINLSQQLLEQDFPLLGICLGHQVLGIACGARCVKMKFGHHGANHPVLDKTSGKVFITSQNHGFAIDQDQLPNELEVTHVSLFDNSIQGLRHKSKPMLSFQGHPEASPGPREMVTVLDQFMPLVNHYAATH